MFKIKNFEEFLKEEIFIKPNSPIQQTQPVQSQPVQPVQNQQTQPIQSTQKANKKLDFTYLDKDANFEKIKEICSSIKSPENEKYIFGIVVNPDFVSETKKFLEDTDIKIISAISYPNGDDKNTHKLTEIKKSISNGADEVNVVMNYNKLIEVMSESDGDKKENMLTNIQTDIRQLVEYCKEKSKTIKIIIEMESLKDEMKILKAVEICKESNVDFITTSTGMYTQNTNYSFENKMKDVEDIIVPSIQGMDNININVSGGINSKDRLTMCLKNSKIQRISTTMLPDVLMKK